MEYMLLLARCWNCGRQIIACPDCVTVVPIDPATNLPPDVQRTSTGAYVNRTPDPDALARAKREPLCDHCASQAGVHQTWMQRHERHQALTTI